MFKRTIAATVVAFSSVMPAHAVVFSSADLASAKNGLQIMRELNVVTFNDLNEFSHVQGKAFVGGSLGGNANATFGQGNGSVGAAASTRPTLAVVNNANTGFTLQNGTNGTNGRVAATPQADIGKNFLVAATTNIDGSGLRVGGTLGPLLNVNGGPAIRYGGTYAGVTTGNGRVSRDGTIAAGGSADLYAALNSQRTTMVTDLSRLSTVLASLTSNGTMSTNGSNVTFDFSGLSPSTGYGAYTIAASSLFSYNGALDIKLGTTSDGAYRPAVINITGGGSYVDALNMNMSDAIAQNVIFNLIGADNLVINANMTGSLLAPTATVTNTSNITGTLVSSVLNQNAEIHLGTFGGTSALIPVGATGAVPELSSWAMMVVGFGVLGGTLRANRRQRGDQRQY